jgi:hypothetical protein
MTLDLDKSVLKIRRDFELLYATMSQKMTSYYEVQMKEMQTHVEEAFHYQRIEVEELAKIQQALELEYVEVQKSFSYQRELLMKTEATYGKKTSVSLSLFAHTEKILLVSCSQVRIRIQLAWIWIWSAIGSAVERDERCTGKYNGSGVLYRWNTTKVRKFLFVTIEQWRTLLFLHKSSSTINLEAEIIVYRHVLDSSEVPMQVAIDVQPQSIRNAMTEQFTVKNERARKGSVGIRECKVTGDRERETVAFISYLQKTVLPMARISVW